MIQIVITTTNHAPDDKQAAASENNSSGYCHQDIDAVKQDQSLIASSGLDI